MEKFVDFKKEKGITLVALVVTIIVLLILAAISIGILLGDNGVVGKAEESRDKTIIAQEKEYIKLAYQKLEMEKAVNGGDITAENLNTELKNYDDKTKVNEIQQSEIGDREIVIKKENSSEYGEIIFEETGHEYVVSLEIDPNKTRYIITYNANGGYGGPTSQTKVEGTDLIITSLTPERKGYLFLGWSESASGNSIQYEAGDRYTKEESKTLYAVWQRNWTDADAVAQIGNTKYPSIQEAVEACSKSAGNTQTTIILLKNTEEEFVTYEGQNIILDLKGFTVTSESTGTLCTNNAKLQIINGVLKSNQGTSITNNGEITIGDNSTGIDDNTPVIYGNKVGVENNGVFNFYDGKIQGFVPIQGTVTNTPDQYGPVSTGYENNNMDQYQQDMKTI